MRASEKEMLARIDERQKAMADKLEEIYDEVKMTNGRVTSLETWRSEIRGTIRATAFISAGIGAAIGFITNYLL